MTRLDTLQDYVDGADARLARFGRSLMTAVRHEPAHLLALRLTLVLILLQAVKAPLAVQAPVCVVVTLMLGIGGDLLRSRALWLALTGLLAIRVARDWLLVDNHDYLLTYWTAACALGVRSPCALAVSARSLVAAAFSFAVAWKLLSGDYLDGTFFVTQMMLDSRIESIGAWLNGMTLEAFRAATEPLRQGIAAADPAAVIPLPISDRLATAALTVSWIGLAIEASVALLHLGRARWCRPARLAALLLFVCSTYLVLPVVGFGILVAIMGLAQSEPEPRFKVAFVAAACLLHLMLAPVQAWVW